MAALLITACGSNPTSPDSATATPTPNPPTSTPTMTTTPTGTLTPTGSISGTLTYTAGTVNVSNTIFVSAAGESNYSTGEFDSSGGFGYTFVATDGGSYSINYLPANTYIVEAYYRVPGYTGSGEYYIPGGYAELYGASGCVTTSSSYVTVQNGNVPNINFNFGNTVQVYGMQGGVTYTGAHTYVSNSQYEIEVAIYDNSSYVNNRNQNWEAVKSDASTYSVIPPEDSGLWCSAQTYYVRAWVTLNSCGSNDVCTGDPYWQSGPVITSNTPGNLNITFDDTNIY